MSGITGNRLIRRQEGEGDRVKRQDKEEEEDWHFCPSLYLDVGDTKARNVYCFSELTHG